MLPSSSFEVLALGDRSVLNPYIWFIQVYYHEYLVYSSPVSGYHIANLKMPVPLHFLRPHVLASSSAVVVLKLGKLNVLSGLETLLEKTFCVY